MPPRQVGFDIPDKQRPAKPKRGSDEDPTPIRFSDQRNNRPMSRNSGPTTQRERMEDFLRQQRKNRPTKSKSGIDLDYRKAQQAAAIKRGGAESTRAVRALNTAVKVGRVASKALPVVGTVASAYEVAESLGGPPTKDPSKFRNYRGFPGAMRPAPEASKAVARAAKRNK